MPSLVVIAGPNGAGNSTAAPEILRAVGADEFINADVIRRRHALGLRNFFALYAPNCRLAGAPLRDVLLRAEVLSRVPRRADAQSAGPQGHVLGRGGLDRR